MSAQRRAVALTLLGVVCVAPAASHAQDCEPFPDFPELCTARMIESAGGRPPDHAIDVVIMGDGFLTPQQFRGAARAHRDAMMNGLAGQLNVPTLVSALNVHVVEIRGGPAFGPIDNDDVDDSPLGVIAREGEFVRAEMDRAAFVAAMTPGLPDADVLYLIARGDGRPNATLPSGLGTGGAVRIGDRDVLMASHELAHAIAHLGDEFEDPARCSLGPETDYARLRNVTSIPGCPKFSAGGAGECIEGSHLCAEGLYRPRPACFMRLGGDTAICSMCSATLATVHGQIARGIDSMPPWASVDPVASPVTGQILVTGEVYDDLNPVGQLEFRVDGRFAGFAMPEPDGRFEFRVDTAWLEDGPHIGYVFATHGVVTAPASAPLLFETLQSPGELPPLHFFRPADGAQIGVGTWIQSWFGGAVPELDRLNRPDNDFFTLLINGSPWTLIESPVQYLRRFNPISASLGLAYDVQVAARSSTGSQVFSEERTVVMGRTDPAEVAWAAPLDGATVGDGWLLMRVRLLDGGAAPRIEVLQEGIPMRATRVLGTREMTINDARPGDEVEILVDLGGVAEGQTRLGIRSLNSNVLFPGPTHVVELEVDPTLPDAVHPPSRTSPSRIGARSRSRGPARSPWVWRWTESWLPPPMERPPRWHGRPRRTEVAA